MTSRHDHAKDSRRPQRGRNRHPRETNLDSGGRRSRLLCPGQKTASRMTLAVHPGWGSRSIAGNCFYVSSSKGNVPLSIFPAYGRPSHPPAGFPRRGKVAPHRVPHGLAFAASLSPSVNSIPRSISSYLERNPYHIHNKGNKKDLGRAGFSSSDSHFFLKRKKCESLERIFRPS